MPKKILITSALPYVNNIPHLGNIIGCVLSADVFARYKRLQGDEVFYVCATDEYGTATETKAIELNKTPQEVCDYYHAIHKKVYESFRIAFDFFGRTTFPEQTELTQAIFLELDRRGYILEKETEQLFCEKDQIFLADRYVTGTCPHCKNENARGDQCEKCSKLLSPTDLIGPKCLLCGSKPILKRTQHLYLDLPKLAPELQTFFQQKSSAGFWPENAKTTTAAWLEQGLQPRPITRDLKWGVPVPKKGYEKKVFYVWFDAVMGYISNTKRCLPTAWQTWWQNPSEVLLYQFMAKDNIPFHTVILPAMELGSGQPWTLLYHIASTEYLNYENSKFSKSRNTGVFGTDVEGTGIDIDLWRFYLLINRPETADAHFLWDEFYFETNSNFIDNIGNLLQRLLVFVAKNKNATIQWKQDFAELKEFEKAAFDLKTKFHQTMERVELRAALRLVLDYGRLGNKFFHDQKPWALDKQDPEKVDSILAALYFSLVDLATMLLPFMPETGKRMLTQLNFQTAGFLSTWPKDVSLKIGQAEILFPKMEKKLFEDLQKKFGDSEESRALQEQFGKFVLAVGQILSLKPHPKLLHLHLLEVNFGELGKKTVFANLKNTLASTEIQGKKALFLYNLASLEREGVSSDAMLLMGNKKSAYEMFEVEAPLGSILATSSFRLPEEQLTKVAAVSLEDFKGLGLKIKNSFLTFQNENLLLEGEEVRLKQIVNGKVV